MAMIAGAEFGVLHQEQEIFIAASRERVWEAITDRIGEWWPKEFLISADAKSFALEARLGGRLLEDWGDGQGAVWGRVIKLRRNEVLQISGELSDVASPAIIHTTYKLEEADGGTRLKLTDLLYGAVSEKVGKSLAEGWEQLLHKHLKPFVES